MLQRQLTDIIRDKLEFDFQPTKKEWKAVGRLHFIPKEHSLPPLDGSRCFYSDWILHCACSCCREDAGFLVHEEPRREDAFIKSSRPIDDGFKCARVYSCPKLRPKTHTQSPFRQRRAAS